jgi:hypothetical protein
MESSVTGNIYQVASLPFFKIIFLRPWIPLAKGDFCPGFDPAEDFPQSCRNDSDGPITNRLR